MEREESQGSFNTGGWMEMNRIIYINNKLGVVASEVGY